MKTSMLLLLVFITLTNFLQTEENCPAYGDATSEKVRALNMLKNRSVSSPVSFNTDVTLNEMFNSGDDPTKFSQEDGATVEGYLFNAKQEKGESCNCHTTDIDKQDIHIYISPHEHPTGIADCLVVEITAKDKALHPEWTAAYIKTMKGHKISVTGYLLFDFEHTHQSYGTNPDFFGFFNPSIPFYLC